MVRLPFEAAEQRGPTPSLSRLCCDQSPIDRGSDPFFQQPPSGLAAWRSSVSQKPTPLILWGIGLLLLAGCAGGADSTTTMLVAENKVEAQVINAGATKTADAPQENISPENSPMPDDKKLETATFAAGCFWCTEAVFQRLKGVEKVVSGYMGGKLENPTYEQVCSGRTGHAECIQLTFDPSLIGYKQLLEVFWKTHDPTTLNRQGNDIGTQYRSAVFFHSPQQRDLATEYKKKLDDAHVFDKPIVTEITEATKFYPAEGYHQNYFNLNKNKNPYCAFVIVPKVEKLHEIFADGLKEDTQR